MKNYSKQIKISKINYTAWMNVTKILLFSWLDNLTT